MPSDKDPLATIIHISDPHFGSKFTNDANALRQFVASLAGGLYPHSYTAARALAITVNGLIEERNGRQVPVCVAFTGDLTRGGESDEFIIGNNFFTNTIATSAGKIGLNLKHRTKIRPGQAGLFAVPGNHDIWQRKNPQHLTEYRGFYQGNYPKECIMETATPSVPLYLFGLNSTQNTQIGHRLARGRVPPEELDDLCRMLGSRKHGVRIVCLHHPLKDPERWETDARMWLEDRVEIGQRLANARVDLVLSGHIHRTEVIAGKSSECPHLVVAASALQQFEKCSFLLIDVFADRFVIHTYFWNRGTGRFETDAHAHMLEIDPPSD